MDYLSDIGDIGEFGHSSIDKSIDQYNDEIYFYERLKKLGKNFAI
jgi:hypothetical protein